MHICAYVYVCGAVFISIYIHIYMHTYLSSYMHTYTCIHICMHMYTLRNIDMYAYIRHVRFTCT